MNGPILQCGSKSLDLGRPRIMGILNTTPDSFYDGGIFLARDQALRHAERMVAEGADIIDVGGESTRPGAPAVSAAEELERVVPVIEALADALPVVISVDTSKATVMRAAVAAGAGLINDVRALRADGALSAAAALDVPVCLMHMQGEPGSMQRQPQYVDVVQEVRAFLEARIAVCHAAGIGPERLLVDPGFGFGKAVEHNLQLLRALAEFGTLGPPMLVGLSRKSMIGALLQIPVEERLAASITLAVIAVAEGARIVRVHDVRATREALRMYEAVYQERVDL